jgi:hypothetical protein
MNRILNPALNADYLDAHVVDQAGRMLERIHAQESGHDRWRDAGAAPGGDRTILVVSRSHGEAERMVELLERARAGRVRVIEDSVAFRAGFGSKTSGFLAGAMMVLMGNNPDADPFEPAPARGEFVDNSPKAVAERRRAGILGRKKARW